MGEGETLVCTDGVFQVHGALAGGSIRFSPCPRNNSCPSTAHGTAVSCPVLSLSYSPSTPPHSIGLAQRSTRRHHSFLPPFIHSLIHLFIHSLVHSFIPPSPFVLLPLTSSRLASPRLARWCACASSVPGSRPTSLCLLETTCPPTQSSPPPTLRCAIRLGTTAPTGACFSLPPHQPVRNPPSYAHANRTPPYYSYPFVQRSHHRLSNPPRIVRRSCLGNLLISTPRGGNTTIIIYKEALVLGT